MRKRLLAAILAIGALLWAGMSVQRDFTAPGPLAEPRTVVVPKGSNLAAVARDLGEAGVIRHPWILIAGARLSSSHPKAGEYLFPAAISARDALTMMAEGRTLVHKLTIAEGLTVRRILDEVRRADYLAGEVARQPAEGSLLPETWHLSRDDQREEVVERMERAMRRTLDTLWAERMAGLPLKTKEEALVLASIVERETGVADERPKVAAVFENRLRLGMKLQSDPTVIYGLSDGWGVLDRPLTHADLAVRHKWNTYVIDGLPPSPIANPGKASIEAVLHPAATDALYFVADGSGHHVFARTLDEHNANVARWRRLMNERREK